MFINIVVILTIAVLGYIWSSRGFFSALLHLVCTIAAGAIAFGVWEPLVIATSNAGLPEWLAGIMWGACLLIPFAISVGILTVLVNLVVRGNAQCEGVADYVGGGICGVFIGIITAGICALSMGFVRSHTDFMGYEPIKQEKAGYLVYKQSLWVPADKLVAGFYSMASTTTLATSEPLARYYPDFVSRGHVMRAGPSEVLLKNSGNQSDVGLANWYTVGAGAAGKLKAEDLLTDTMNPVRQTYKDLNDEPIPAPCKIAGFVLATKAGMRERNGQVIFGPGSATLIVESRDEEGVTVAYQPIAAISQAKGDNTDLGRWRFDGEKTFIASAGAAANPPVALEFLLPKDAVPVALYVKGVRLSLIDETTEQLKKPFAEYEDAADRDSAIRSRAIFADALAGGAVTTASGGTIKADESGSPVTATNRFPFRTTLNKGNASQLTLSNPNEGKTNYVVSGDGKFRKSDMLETGGDRALRLEEFYVDNDTVIVQVDVSPTSALSMTAPESKEATGAPVLIDNKGQRFEAVGFFYKDANLYHIRFMPGSPIQSLNDLPSVSNNRTDQQIVLIFRCSINVEIKSYAIGSTGIKDITPPLILKNKQRR